MRPKCDLSVDGGWPNGRRRASENGTRTELKRSNSNLRELYPIGDRCNNNSLDYTRKGVILLFLITLYPKGCNLA